MLGRRGRRKSEPMCGVRAVGVRAPRARALAGARARGEPRPSRGCRRPGPGRRAAARWPGGRCAPAARRSPRHAAAVARSRSRVAVARGVSRAISANCPDAGPVRVANMPPCRDRWALALGNTKGELRPKSSRTTRTTKGELRPKSSRTTRTFRYINNLRKREGG